MPVAAHKGAIAFGLVYIPVQFFSAIGENRVSFNQLHKGSMARIRYKKVREDTGEEVAPEEIVRGYQYEKGKYVTLTDDEIELMKTPKDRAITISRFVERGSIDPVFYEKSYHVAPDGSDKAFHLLRQAMLQQGVVAVATSVLGTKDAVLMLSPNEQGMLAKSLYYLSEIKTVPMPTAQVGLSQQEIEMANMLVQSMQGSFQPELYQDHYEERLREAIMAKVQGQEIVAPAQPPNNVIDLMDALQRSLAHQPQPGTWMPPPQAPPAFARQQ